MRKALFSTALLAFACHGPGTARGPEPAPPAEGAKPGQERPGGDARSAPGELELLESLPPAPPSRAWSVRFKYPVLIGYTDFDLMDGQALDNLTTLAVVPTAEFVRPLGGGWTLLPFIGLGAGWLVDDDQEVYILTTGLRAEWEHGLGEDTVLRVLPRVRYDANLNRPDGLLGDWGRFDLAVELRQALGTPESRVRLQPGVFAQGFWFWDDIDFDVPGLAPDSVHEQVELGLSLGTHEPFEVLGFELPRVFIGARVGDGIETYSIRFGEL